jgi:excisionase family DNA binding protein
MNIEAPLALRPRQAAETLGISARHLWQLTHDGLIPCVRVGSGRRKTVLYPTESLRTWLHSASQGRRGPGNGGAR